MAAVRNKTSPKENEGRCVANGNNALYRANPPSPGIRNFFKFHPPSSKTSLRGEKSPLLHLFLPPVMASSENQTEILHDFLLTTTAHGYYKLAVLRGRHLFRYLWSAILVFFVIGFTIHLGSLLLNFFRYPLTTEIGFNEIPYR